MSNSGQDRTLPNVARLHQGTATTSRLADVGVARYYYMMFCCLPTYLCAYRPIYLLTCLLACLPAYLHACMKACTHSCVRTYIGPTYIIGIHPSACLSVCLYVCNYVHVLVCMYARMYVRMRVYVSV